MYSRVRSSLSPPDRKTLPEFTERIPAASFFMHILIKKSLSPRKGKTFFILFLSVINLHAQLLLKFPEGTVPRQHGQQHIGQRSADQRSADEERYIVHPRKSRTAVENFHDRIGCHRTDDAGSDDFPQNSRPETALGCPVKNP